MQELIKEMEFSHESGEKLNAESIYTSKPQMEDMNDVLVQIKIDKEEIPVNYRYKNAWNLFFIHRDWYLNDAKQRQKLQKIFPCFVITKMENPFTAFEDLNYYFQNYFVVMPFKKITYSGERRPSIEFIGWNLNKTTMDHKEFFQTNYARIDIVDVNVYGYFLNLENALSLHSTLNHITNTKMSLITDWVGTTANKGINFEKPTFIQLVDICEEMILEGDDKNEDNNL